MIPDGQIASELKLTPDDDDGTPRVRLELLDEDKEVIATFHMNLQTAETVCISLAMWYNAHLPGQTAPTTSRIQ